MDVYSSASELKETIRRLRQSVVDRSCVAEPKTQEADNKIQNDVPTPLKQNLQLSTIGRLDLLHQFQNGRPISPNSRKQFFERFREESKTPKHEPTLEERIEDIRNIITQIKHNDEKVVIITDSRPSIEPNDRAGATTAPKIQEKSEITEKKPTSVADTEQIDEDSGLDTSIQILAGAPKPRKSSLYDEVTKWLTVDVNEIDLDNLLDTDVESCFGKSDFTSPSKKMFLLNSVSNLDILQCPSPSSSEFDFSVNDIDIFSANPGTAHMNIFEKPPISSDMNIEKPNILKEKMETSVTVTRSIGIQTIPESKKARDSPIARMFLRYLLMAQTKNKKKIILKLKPKAHPKVQEPQMSYDVEKEKVNLEYDSLVANVNSMF